MTIADQIDDHQTRCQPHLLSLRMVVGHEAGTALSRQAVLEVIQATEAILAEAEAAVMDARAGTFLGVRLSRLASAADDVVAAARAGDTAQLRRHLHRFDVLTSAIWTVRQGVYGPRWFAETAKPRP
jgi:hypothetical protein